MVSHHPYRSETLPLNHAAPITQVVHLEDLYTRQPHLTTWVEAWSSSPSLMSPSNDSNGQMNAGMRTLTQGIAFIVQTMGIGTPNALIPMWVVDLPDIVWSQ